MAISPTDIRIKDVNKALEEQFLDRLEKQIDQELIQGCRKISLGDTLHENTKKRLVELYTIAG